MWRSKKFIIAAVLAVVVLVGVVGGVALAQTSSPTPDSGQTLFGRVAAILGIDQQKLENAFNQAQKEMRAESMKTYLDKLVEAGKITQQQADEYLKWWQAKPDVPAGLGSGFPGGKFRGGRCEMIFSPQDDTNHLNR